MTDKHIHTQYSASYQIPECLCKSSPHKALLVRLAPPPPTGVIKIFYFQQPPHLGHVSFNNWDIENRQNPLFAHCFIHYFLHFHLISYYVQYEQLIDSLKYNVRKFGLRLRRWKISLLATFLLSAVSILLQLELEQSVRCP